MADTAMAETKTAPKAYSAKHRYARITARKARLVADLIRGRGVNDALEVLQFQHKRAASYYTKLVRSAMANAGQTNDDVDVNRLVITDCRADDGPMLQGRMRFRPGPQGRAHPFKKLTSHLTVVVSEPAGGTRRRRGKKAAAEAAAPQASDTGAAAVAPAKKSKKAKATKKASGQPGSAAKE
jgi:large subunit ribosomal protein L22